MVRVPVSEYESDRDPMRTALVIYMIVYALVVGGTLILYVWAVPADEKKDDRWWTTPLDALLAGLAFIGMFLLATDHDSAALRGTWKVLAPAMVAIQLFLNVRARLAHMHAVNDRADLHVPSADLGVLLFVSPALALNLVYAFHK